MNIKVLFFGATADAAGKREVEMSFDGHINAEEAFYADSDAVIATLSLLAAGDAGQDERWRLGLAGAHRLLVDLGLDDGRRDCQEAADTDLADAAGGLRQEHDAGQHDERAEREHNPVHGFSS